MSILTHNEIKSAMSASPPLVIDPFDPERLGPNSYDVTLAPRMLRYKLRDADGYPRPLDCREPPETIELTIPPAGMILEPGVLYLGSTVEYTESPRHAPKLNGKSSLGRLGLFVHVTAGEGDVGFCGRWTLEILVVHPLRVYPNMPVAQLLWQTITSVPAVTYAVRSSSKYRGQMGPVPSMMYRNFARKR